MLFSLAVIGPGLAFLLAGLLLVVVTGQREPGVSVASVGMVWLLIAAPVMKRYWRTRVTAKAWKDARRPR